jgi:hypothetical protein
MEYASINHSDSAEAQRSYDEWSEAHGEPLDHQRADDNLLLLMQERLDAAKEA